MTEDTFHETVAPLPHSCSLVTNCTARRRMIVGRILTLSSFARVQRSEMLLESSTPPELHSTAPTGSVLWVWPRQPTPEQTEAQWPPNLPRTRSSHNVAKPFDANFGFKSGTTRINLRASLSIPKFVRACCKW